MFAPPKFLGWLCHCFKERRMQYAVYIYFT